jgi:hypothetical protein
MSKLKNTFVFDMLEKRTELFSSLLEKEIAPIHKKIVTLWTLEGLHKYPFLKNDNTFLSSLFSVPPILRYGKYCGVMYTGCPGEKPCDAFDACCMVHDACVTSRNSIPSVPFFHSTSLSRYKYTSRFKTERNCLF